MQNIPKLVFLCVLIKPYQDERDMAGGGAAVPSKVFCMIKCLRAFKNLHHIWKTQGLVWLKPMVHLGDHWGLRPEC